METDQHRSTPVPSWRAFTLNGQHTSIYHPNQQTKQQQHDVIIICCCLIEAWACLIAGHYLGYLGLASHCSRPVEIRRNIIQKINIIVPVVNSKKFKVTPLSLFSLPLPVHQSPMNTIVVGCFTWEVKNHKYVTNHRLDNNSYTGVGNSEDTMMSSNFNDVLTRICPDWWPCRVPERTSL